MTQLAAAALIAEHLARLERLPPGVFASPKHPALAFTAACPPASGEVSNTTILIDSPNVRGWCRSVYFCESGLIELIYTAMTSAKRAMLFEVAIRISNLLRPLAELRRLWPLLQRQFDDAAFAWQAIVSVGSKSDRALGNYYRVQFQDRSVYVYRETHLANLWQVMEKLKARAAVLAGGKPVVVQNDGEELVAAKLDPANYYVHVKAVEQHFTAEERRQRMTVFEQNHDVRRFYFDLPFSKMAQSSIEHCWLKRTIFVLPQPIPYLNSRVHIPPENIQKLEYSPIEYCCQNLQLQVDRIDDAVQKSQLEGDYRSLQPLIQGSLIVQVNEGPQKMAEVFLAGATENQHTMNLRAIFRLFLEANRKAVEAHESFATKNPVYTALQEELDAGLKRLRVALQPFLK
jgi:hypothetical protein